MKGHTDVLSESLIAGWAHNPEHPGQRLLVNVFVAGVLVGTASAEHFRADLLAAGIGDGWKAFHFDPRRFILGENEEVTITFASTGQLIPNGLGRLSRSRISNTPDWDAPRKPVSRTTPLDRLQAHEPSRWPTFQIDLVVGNESVEALERSVSSLLAQCYSRWELSLSKQPYPAASLGSYLNKLAASDGRVRLPTTAAAIPHPGTAVFRASLVGGDSLEPDALLEAAVRILEHPETEAIYFDHDCRDSAGELIETFHKPAWSPVYFLGTGCTGNFVIQKVAPTDAPADIHNQPASEDRLLAKPADTIQHIPRVLLHQRAEVPSTVRRANHAQARLDQLAWPIRAETNPARSDRAHLQPLAGGRRPKVSVIIPTRDAPRHIETCLRGIFSRSNYPNLEVVVVDNGTTDPEALRVLSTFPLTWLKDPRPFNFSQLNNHAAHQATGDVLVFLNNDTEVITPDWLQIMLAHLELPGVGVVGPLMLYPDGTVQHAGMVLGLLGSAGHVMRGFPADCDGYHGSLACSREVSAVTGACLMISRQLFDELGGFDEDYRLVYQDVDLCLRARERGKSVLYVANARLTHAESATRGPDYDQADRSRFLSRWSALIAAGDPYYNPNFTRNRSDYCLH